MSAMQIIVKAAVVQAAPVMFDTGSTLAKLATLAGEAAGQGARIVVFPEAFVGGYPKGLDFGARLGSRSPQGRDDFRRYYDSAIAVPSPQSELIATAARDNHLHLVVGVIERSGGTLYCAALMYGPDGALLGIHRKLMPTALERLVWGYGDGSTLAVVDSELGRSAASSAGRTTCRCCAWRCTHRASSCTALLPSMIARPGCRRCA